MESKLLYESAGATNTARIGSFIGGIIFLIMGIMSFCIRNIKTRSLYSYHYLFDDTVRFIFLLITGILWIMTLYCLNACYIMLKSFIRIYSDKIECTATSTKDILLGRKMPTIVLDYNDIAWVNSKERNGLLLIEVYGKRNIIFCRECNMVEQIIQNKLLTLKHD